jgi:glutaminyl-tRNA synthetase
VHEEPHSATAEESKRDFIREIITADRKAGKHGGRVVTRFPPEPNGYLHIGHAKSICLNFGVAGDYGGVCHLRFDDSNPAGESLEYVESIQRDVRWLGFDWGERLFYASDYFERLYAIAVDLIRRGKAYVCSLSDEQIREFRGTISEPGRPSPFRERSVEENLDLFERMRAGEFPNGAHVLRARIDMAAANMKMRDPLLYRIRHVPHYRHGTSWCIYPLYDFIHCLSDAFEGITHSICTLEFESNRELYDWIVAHADAPHRPRQYEFARLNLTYTVMSKRRLLQLVQGGHVSGWDDPRMPTIAGLRRRGYTPEGIRAFCDRIGVAKNNSTVEVALLEHCIRDDLNPKSPRVMAVLRPLRVVIENYPEDRTEQLDAPYWPHDIPKQGTRQVPFSRELFIEREDFMLNPPKSFHRLTVGGEVRLRYAYVIRCHDVVRDSATGDVVELRCTYDPASHGGDAAGRKVKGTIHWVSQRDSVEAEVRLYDRLFNMESPGAGDGEFIGDINPSSLVTITTARLEPSLATARAGDRVQFERHGFFFVDPVDSRDGRPVFNRTVPLKDTWAKLQAADNTVAPPTAARASAPAKSTQPEMAVAQRALSEGATKLKSELGIGEEEARVLASEGPLRMIFEEAVAAGSPAKTAARWIVNELSGALKLANGDQVPFGGRELHDLLDLLERNTINATIAKDVLAKMVATGQAPRAIVEREGLEQIADTSALDAVVARVLDGNAATVARYRAGNKNLVGAFVGMVMKETGGKANPKLVGDLVRRRLD